VEDPSLLDRISEFAASKKVSENHEKLSNHLLRTIERKVSNCLSMIELEMDYVSIERRKGKEGDCIHH
jgi:hypothetical protein